MFIFHNSQHKATIFISWLVKFVFNIENFRKCGLISGISITGSNSNAQAGANGGGFGSIQHL